MGALVAYDESILDGDAILADAIWRYCTFKARVELDEIWQLFVEMCLVKIATFHR